MDTLDGATRSNEENGISPRIKEYLIETTKWAKFLAIVGFIGVGLMVLASLFLIAAGAMMPIQGGPPLAILAVVYLILATLMFFPTLYLLNFSIKMRKGLDDSENSDVEKGFENLKSYFKFVGIFTIVILSFYVLGILAGIMGAAIR